MQTLSEIKKSLKELSNPSYASVLQKFFQTGKGQYAEGDVFIGISVPQIREIVNTFWQDSTLSDIELLLNSEIHEERALALLILVKKFEKYKTPADKKEVVDFYILEKTLKRINNWDLVDLSCYKILGEYLVDKPDETSILYNFAKSSNLWVRRISIVSTFAFIRKFSFSDTVNISRELLDDDHHIIHKGVGWMLREAGKKNINVLTDFLDLYASKMPRTCLRYAIEKLPEEERRAYMKK